jgi:hypothetical protein
MAALILFALVCIAPQDTVVPSPLAPAGAISGTVVDARTGAPIADAVVSLRRAGPPSTAPGEGLTDAKGRFVFRSLAAGDYIITVTRFGYADGGFGRTPQLATPRTVALADAEWFSDAHVLLWRPAAVSGRVTDERGEPVVGVPVRVLALLSIGRRQQLAAGPGATTDDRGMYRIAGLRPGKYIVNVPSVQSALPAGVSADPKRSPSGAAVAPRPILASSDGHRLILGYYATPPAANGRTLAYPPVFHPNARTVTEASVVDLAPGDDREGVDLRLEPVPSARISGTVDGPPEAVAGLLLRLVTAGSEELGVGSETATTIVAGNGTFAFLNVPAGAYTIDAARGVAQYEWPAANGRVGSAWTATPPGYALDGMVMMSGAASAPAGTMFTMRAAPGTAAYWGRTAVVVEGRDLEDVIVTMRRGASLRGRIVWETAAKVREETEFVSVLGEPTSGNLAFALSTGGFGRRQTGSTFTIEGMLPTSYSLRLMMGGNWTVKSITWNGRDHTYVPFDASSGADFDGVVVTLTDKIAGIRGTARDAQGNVANGAIVIAFPVERELWTSAGLSPPRMREVAAGSAGTYRLANLPAGDYYVMAIDPAGADTDANAWRDQAFLDSAHQLAERVALQWGETKTLDLRVVKMR